MAVVLVRGPLGRSTPRPKHTSVAYVLDVVEIKGKRLPLAAEVEAEAGLDLREVFAVERDAVARPGLFERDVLELAVRRVGERLVLDAPP